MIPFHIDPRWFDDHWYGASPNEAGPNEAAPADAGAAEAAPQRSPLVVRVAVCLALVAALPAVSYFGFEAAAGRPTAHAPARQN